MRKRRSFTNLARVAACPLVLALASSCASSKSIGSNRAAAAQALAREAVLRETDLNVANIPSNTLSVAPFSVMAADTSYTSLGFGLAALLVSDLSRSPGLVLVERQRIDAIMREIDLAQSRRVDTMTAPRIGKLIGARRVIVGSVDIPRNGNLHIGTYIADTRTGRVSSSLAGTGTLTQLFDTEKALVFRLFDALSITLSPSQRRAIEARPTRSLAAFMLFSRGARAEAFGEMTSASGFYAQALKIDPGFALAGQGLAAVNGTTVADAGSPSSITRAATITTDLVNRPSPVLIGSGSDVPVSTRQQLITFTITVRTP